MTRMENLGPTLNEQERQDAVYAAAMRSINAETRDRERQGYVVMSAAMNYGEGSLGGGAFGAVSKAAQLFMILFACVLPPALVWYVLL